MSEQELYEIASKRIDQRTRRWSLWALNLAVLVFFLAGVLLLDGQTLAVAAFLAWGGVFTFHTIVAGFAEARQGEIDSLMDKLRDARDRERDYEKPKRLQLSEDGELVDDDELIAEKRQQRLNS